MPSRNEITKAVARRLAALEQPNANPDEEVELVGGVSESLVTRSEDSGLGRVRYGPRYAQHWREAEKLAIAVEVAVDLR